MEKLREFLQFQQNNTTSIFDFIINCLLCYTFSSVISVLYIKYGFTLTNRKRFAQNFVILAIATLFVIAIVKSSLALSLGLVGALSIVRFRTPIKEPEELMMLFINLAIGLGLGADQRAITLTATFFFSVVLIIRYKRSNRENKNLNNLLLIQYNGENIISYSDIIAYLNNNLDEIILKKIEYQPNYYELLIQVNFTDFDTLRKIIEELTTKEPSLQISILEL